MGHSIRDLEGQGLSLDDALAWYDHLDSVTVQLQTFAEVVRTDSEELSTVEVSGDLELRLKIADDRAAFLRYEPLLRMQRRKELEHLPPGLQAIALLSVRVKGKAELLG
eukprot:CAMPEP_0184319602 /NCGR_PEP_ID=MMETSP1049-20130417/109462_1 /TAXON_ID=77928 /ORGANISM="Proteomonas sulcata, Strain CCMP704" /LENGTH=108 /DNA_ID=CAMNT_0026639803 /DNA_START=114 /DNA_END=440 /DNA_ORIENTATION=+